MRESWRRPLAFWAVALVAAGTGALALVDRPAVELAVGTSVEDGGEAPASATPTTATPAKATPSKATPTTTATTALPPPPTTAAAVPPTDPAAAVTSGGSLARATGSGAGDPDLVLPPHCIPGTDDGQGGCRHQPWTISGTVTDGAGRPLAGICVHTLDPGSPVAATTGPDGRYTVVIPHTHWPVGRFADCTDDPFGWMEVRPGVLRAQPGETTVFDVVMTRYAGIDGRIVDVDGDPVAGACFGDVRTGPDGRFRVGGIEPGERAVTAQGDNCPIQYLSVPRETYRFESGRWTEVTITVTLVGQVPPSGWLPPAG